MFMTINSYFYPTQHSWACSCLGEKKVYVSRNLATKTKKIQDWQVTTFFFQTSFLLQGNNPVKWWKFWLLVHFLHKISAKVGSFLLSFFASKLKWIVIGYGSNVLFSTLMWTSMLFTHFSSFTATAWKYTCFFFKNNFIKTVSLRFWWN